MNSSSFFKLNTKDLIKGLSIAVITVVIGAVQQALTQHGFDFGAYDWPTIVNVAITAGVAYLAKNLLSTEDGKVLGSIG
ncbi:hypothetical protein LCGC14_1331040 [marine sediment metagenome]|uniref:Holin n=1 Tax=marine sediment metagenome TaxID=412755 RepID=A0A0F9MXF7_9ZZZZ